MLGGAISIVVVALIFAWGSLRVLREYERGVMFTLGRFSRVRGPGLIFLIPFIQQIVRVDLRTVVMKVPSQDLISRDNVSVKVDAVLYFHVVDPEKSVIAVDHFGPATNMLAQTTLRSVLGHTILNEMLAERKKLETDVQDILDSPHRGLGIQAQRSRDSRRTTQREHGQGDREAGRG